MKFLMPLFVFLAVGAFHSVLSASLESAEKEEKAAKYDGLAELQKIDQMEFEAAQKNQAAEMNVTEDQSEDTHYLEAAQDGSEEERVERSSEKAPSGESSDNTEGSQTESCEDTSENQDKSPDTVSSSEESTPEASNE